MADLNELQAAGATKIVGSDGTGLETNPVNATANGGLHSNLRNQAGTEVGTASDPIRVDPTGTTAQPMTLKGIVDTGNSSVSNLGVGGVFTGAWTDILNYNNISIAVFANQNSQTNGLVIQWSNDGSTVHNQDSFTVTANQGKQFSFGRLSKYFRLTYTNNSVAQTIFSIQTILSTGDMKPSSHRVDDSISPQDDATLVKSTITGKASDGNYYNVKVDTEGRLVTSAVTGFGADFAFGDVTTAATAQSVVRRTSYTEQTTNGQRSVASSSANDTAAGTGARTIVITYYDQTGAGPFTETITMNGTSRVNTVATNICFIEQMEVVTAGSGGANAGIVTLYTIPTAGGSAIGTMATGDNQTFWAHHYVGIGKECNITGVSCGHNGTTVGSGALFFVKARTIGVANVIERQVTDFIRLYGQSSTFARTYTSPVKVIGPARLILYVTPETSTSTVYRGAFDFFEP